jgi:quinol monooxygenase YgiN
MVIVTGHLLVDPARRDALLEESRSSVEEARVADGCVDFAVSPDLVEPDRVNVSERWRDRASLDAFRGQGPGGEMGDMIRSYHVAEYDVAD